MIENSESWVACPACGQSFVSAEEAARIMGVSYARVRAILADHPERLSALRLGRTWIIPKQAAQEFQSLPPHRPRRRSTGSK